MVAISNQIEQVEQSPTDSDFVQNPYNFYRDIRAKGNFVYWKDYGLAIATTQAAVAQILKHPKMGRAAPEPVECPDHLKPFYAIERKSLLELEGREHTRIRRMAASGFNRAHMAMMAPAVSQIADDLISHFPKGKPFDLLDAYAKPLTARTITAFLGMDAGDAQKMQFWSNLMVAMYQARRDMTVELAAAEASKNFSSFISDYIDTRRKVSRDDFLGELLAAEDAGEITRDELLSTVILLLNAGQEATAHAIGNSVNLLAAFPERSLALHPEQIASTVEECLRFAPPLHMFKRYVYEPVKLMELELPAGCEVGCLLGASCRDDAVWPDGDKFDPFRARRVHQAFGVGLHACLGASLARLEMQIALPALFSRCPDLKIVEPPTVANLYHFHGLEELMVQIK